MPNIKKNHLKVQIKNFLNGILPSYLKSDSKLLT